MGAVSCSLSILTMEVYVAVCEILNVNGVTLKTRLGVVQVTEIGAVL